MLYASLPACINRAITQLPPICFRLPHIYIPIYIFGGMREFNGKTPTLCHFLLPWEETHAYILKTDRHITKRQQKWGGQTGLIEVERGHGGSLIVWHAVSPGHCAVFVSV